jgi:hypothetical protein
LPPFGCEAVVNPANAVFLMKVRLPVLGPLRSPTGASPLATGFCVYSVKVSLLTSAPGNNAEAVARWL